MLSIQTFAIKELFKNYLLKSPSRQEQAALACVLEEYSNEELFDVLDSVVLTEEFEKVAANDHSAHTHNWNLVLQWIIHHPDAAVTAPNKRAGLRQHFKKFALGYSIMFMIAMASGIYLWRRYTISPLTDVAACGLKLPPAVNKKGTNSIVQLSAINGKKAVYIPRCWQYKFALPDGSNVLMNAATSIHYPETFNTDAREAEVDGEAFFSVTDNGKHPFVVHAKGVKIETAGAVFNVNTYPDQEVITCTVITGNLKLTNGQTTRMLKPGEQASVSATARDTAIHIKTVDPLCSETWRQGYFQFNNASIRTVINEFARWYDWVVIYKDEDLKGKFSGIICRKEPENIVLDVLYNSNVNITKQGKNVTVSAPEKHMPYN